MVPATCSCRRSPAPLAKRRTYTGNRNVKTITPVLLSGGSGTRLWPVSRALYPKQLLPMAAEHSMLQETALRFVGLEGARPPLVICNDEHRFMIAAQLQELGVTPRAIVLEPSGQT